MTRHAQETQRVAYNLIAEVAARAERFLLDPEPGSYAEEETRQLEALLTAGTDTIKALTSSSSPLYALRDCPQEVQNAIKKATHAIRILKSLHHPQQTREAQS